MEKKKILFGITSLTLGGAERVLVDLANELCEKYEITIFTIYAKGELEKQLSPKVRLQSLYPISFAMLTKAQKHVFMPLKIWLRKKHIYQTKIKRDYDVEIAFLEGPITRLFSTENKETRKIAWVHNDISAVFGKGVKAKIKKWIDKKVYEKYQKIIFVSQDNKKKFEKIYQIKNEKEVIYNYIKKELVKEKANQKVSIEFDKKTINILTVARLVQQKAIDRLIKIHSKLIKEGIEHKIYVIGEGPERQKLEKIIKEEKVENSFILLGKKENPYPYIKQADYFALLSYYEGYPMVLLEARILGKDIIITDTAARETLKNYSHGKVVKNEEKEILSALREIIQKKKVKEEIKKEEYENEYILEKVKEIIETA
mgnify:CR=1 FL=1